MREMRTIVLALMIAAVSSATAQSWRNAIIILPDDKPLDNPYQFPNYYQNNASYINNSMQNNRPPIPRSGIYTGNADYTNPTRRNIVPYFYGNTTNPSIGAGSSNVTNTVKGNLETNRR